MCLHVTKLFPQLTTNPSSFNFQTSELGVTEHVEGDPCKFALWVGRTPTSDNKIVLKVIGIHTSKQMGNL